LVVVGHGLNGSGFKVQGSRFRVQGSGFKVQGSWVSRFMVEITLNVERGTWNRSI
jgi:hypothetical protein